MALNIIEEKFRKFCGFLNEPLFAHLCFRVIELIFVVFFLYLACCLKTVYTVENYLAPKMLVNLLQYRGAARFFNNRKYTNKPQYKGVSKLTLIKTCFIFTYAVIQ